MDGSTGADNVIAGRIAERALASESANTENWREILNEKTLVQPMNVWSGASDVENVFDHESSS